MLTRNEYHVVKQDFYLISEGIHDEIISEENWNLAQKKRQETGVGNEKVHKTPGTVLIDFKRNDYYLARLFNDRIETLHSYIIISGLIVE